MEEKKLVPELRFKDYDDEWKEHLLGNIFSTIPFKPFIAEPQISGCFPIIQQGNEPILGFSNNLPCEEYANTVLLGDHTLSIYKPLSPFLVASDGLKILKSDKLSGIPFYYFLEKYKPLPEGYKRHFSILTDKKCFLPTDTREQDAIGDYFKKLDGLIADTEKEIERLEKLKTASLQKMFPQPGESVPQIRFKGFTEPWEEKNLGEISNIYQPLTISQDELSDSGYPVFGANGIIGYYSRYNHEYPQIAVTCRGNTCGTLNMTRPKSWITGNAMVINLDDSINDKLFIFYFLESMDLTSLVSGSGQPQITRKPLTELLIFLPSIEEQKVIGEYFRNLDNLIKEKKKKVSQLRNLKKASLSKMFVNTVNQ